MVALRLLYAGRGVLDRLEEGLEVRADWGVDQDSLVEVPVPQRLDSAVNEDFAGLYLSDYVMSNIRHIACCAKIIRNIMLVRYLRYIYAMYICTILLRVLRVG